MRTLSIIFTITFFCIAMIVSAQELKAQSIIFSLKDAAVYNMGSDVAAVDVDKDGDNDLIATSYGEGLCWFENDGSMNFTKKVIADATAEPQARSFNIFLHDGSIIDFNNDGYVDIVAAIFGNNQISIWINDGTGNFTKNVVENAGARPHTVDVIDIDKDGDLDILAAAFGSSTLDGYFAVYTNQGSMNFNKKVLHIAPETSPTFIYAEDIDSDNDYDILFTEYSDYLLTPIGWYEKNDTGYVKHSIDVYKGFHTAMLKDFDKDGDYDILAAAFSGKSFFVYINDGTGIFTKSWEMYGMGAIWLDMSDMDNDGDNDLIAACENPGVSPDVYYIENKGTGNLVSTTLSTDLGKVYCAKPFDLDKDGDLDIISIANTSNKIIWWENNLNETGVFKKKTINDNNILIFPNPGKNLITFNFSIENSVNSQLIITDISGRTIEKLDLRNLTIGQNSVSLNTSEYKCGVYFCTIISINTVINSSKFTIN